MEESEGVMFEDGDFEVVDECTGEEDPANTENDNPEETSSSEKKDPASSDKQDNIAQKSEDQSKSNDQDASNAKSEAVQPAQTSGNNDAAVTIIDDKVDAQTKENLSDGNKKSAIDFTADISMENDVNKNEDAKDDDVIHLDEVIHLENPETICLDTEDEQSKKDTSPTENETNIENSDAVSIPNEMDLVPDIPPEHAWYEEKINSKLATVKERLSKLARVLEYSYPSYKPWLEHSKDPVCHLDPPRRCPLDRPHTNRWKFICSRKPVQESTNKEEDSAEGTVNKKVETVWRLGPTDGSGVNTDNASQYPPFVIRVVKIFEEFIQKIDETLDRDASVDAAPEVIPETVSKAVSDAVSEAAVPETVTEAKNDDDKPKEVVTNDEKEVSGNHEWLWLLVRSNSKDELMVFATGKKISHVTMEKLKETFETGPGKDCNVKSLYCKSIVKDGNTFNSNITFLVGSEALDETVGGLKIQLAPKTNFWCNAAGAETLGAAVGDLLSPVPKTTVVEVGCGLGLIGLMIAPKCRQVIGLDTQSEVEEAEMTSELNKIKNSSFVMGQPSEMMAKVAKMVKTTKASAIVNANTKIGRTIEVMTALRKIPSIRRVVMITTLTKQSVRAILELTRPADGDLGNPFMPVRAVLVDTLPVGPHFEVVIRMERFIMQKMNEPWFWGHVQFRAGLAPREVPQKASQNKGNEKGSPGKNAGAKGSNSAKTSAAVANKRANNRSNKRNKMKKQAQERAAQGNVTPGKNPPKNFVKNPLASASKLPPKNQAKNSVPKSPPKGKRPNSPDRSNAGAKKFASNQQSPKSSQASKFSPASPKPHQPGDKILPRPNKPQWSRRRNPFARSGTLRPPTTTAPQKRKRDWAADVSLMRGQPVPEKRMREDNSDLRVRLSGGRMDPALVQQIQEQQMLLNVAQQRLNVQGPSVDVDTAKQLQNMLNLVLEQTNKLQSQLPRSVWDRIAPPGNTGYSSPPQNQQRDNAMFRDRFVQDIGPQNILITTSNREFSQQNQGPVPLFKQYIPPPEHNQIMPAGMRPSELAPVTQHLSGRPMPDRSQDRDFRRPQDRGNDWGNSDRQNNPFEKNRSSQPSLNKAPSSSQVEPTVRASSPKRPLVTPAKLPTPPPRRYVAPFSQTYQPLRRPHTSPPRRQASPPRRQASPPRNQGAPVRNEIFQRRPAALAQGNKQQQQQSSEVTRRAISPQRREQPSNTRAVSPVKRFGDEWDIPSRGASEQMNWYQRQMHQQSQQPQQQQQQSQQQQSQLQSQQQQQQRSSDRSTLEKRWQNDRQQNTQNWNQSTSNDRYRKDGNQDKWSSKGSSNEGTWMTGGGDVFNSKQTSVKPSNSDLWSQGLDKQWDGGQGSSGSNWNSRGKEGYGQSNNRMDTWRGQNKGDKEDWSDLPEDARDPWGDDGGAGSKSRWQPADKPSSSNWNRDNNNKMDQGWNKSCGNWQNKGMSMGNNKPQWSSNMGNQNSNEQRWMPQNDGQKKSLSSSNWQGMGSNISSWRPQNLSGFSQQQQQQQLQQRQNLFGSNNFKDGR